MDLESIIVTDVLEVQTVYSKRGRKFEMKNRKTYGLTFCVDDG